MNNAPQLTLEQQFSLLTFENQVKQMSREQAQQFLIDYHKSMVVRDNMYKDLIQKQWGI